MHNSSRLGLLVFLLLISGLVHTSALPGLPPSSAVDQELVAEVRSTSATTSWSVAQRWQQLNLWILQQQRDFHRQLVHQVEAYAEQQRWSLAWSLMLVSFLYGVFHAAGPGHGKAVLTTYLLTQPEALRRGLFYSVLAALLQGVTAILLVAVLVLGLGALAREAFQSVIYLEMLSFVLVALLGAWLVWRSWRAWRRAALPPAPAFTPLPTQAVSAVLKPSLTPRLDLAPTEAACAQCGKVHHVAPKDLEHKSFWQGAGLILSIGLRPCSGAVLLLAVTSLLGIFWIGVLSTLAMALGTALTVASLALIAVKARDWAQRLLHLQQGGWSRATLVLSALGGGVLMALGFSLAWNLWMVEAPSGFL